ncbi:alpha/beta hydrolase family protein [Propionibacterium freudenreichii]|uniref:alpha/beta hydrolase family protein n=1 Tax=Propionibacterium freudenreichii TaxID=1744 RepID=UPI000BC31928|nr:prolyl oligopeptidase family serine peptidase [Propionibacterium freudenreichii]SBN43643.1 Peptidase, S9C (Acylaminoacyl-peptidase) family [Propionibacterium freudenreichii]
MTTAPQHQGPTVADYGAWSSPLTPAETVAAGVTLREFGSDGDDLYWLESASDDVARLSLLRSRDGQIVEITAAPMNVRTRVYEYGGGSWGARQGTVAWSDDTSGQVMATSLGGLTMAITPVDPNYRYAAFVPVPEHECIVCVREDHSAPGEPILTIAALAWPTDDVVPHAGTVLVEGADFYADPTVNEDGSIAWIEWNQPAMAWDASALRAGTLVSIPELAVMHVHTVFDGQHDPGSPVSIQHPKWASDGRLLFMSDAAGYWNLHMWTPTRGIRQLVDEAADGDLPMWQQGRSAFALSGGWIYYASWDAGICSLSRVPAHGGASEALTSVSDVDGLASVGGTAYALVTRPNAPAAVVSIGAEGMRIEHSPGVLPDPKITSVAHSLTFEGKHGQVQSWFFEPHNEDFVAPAGQLPPVILTVHGGPTGVATDEYDPQVQFWTSRGFGVLPVNYSGSAGFGRAYRERLRGQWGIADVDDCIDAAESLLSADLADQSKIAIMGGSAGGFTVLAALTRSSVFSAGICRYGIADLVAMQEGGTHKFEATYNDGLLGPWPQARKVYEERSPIHHLDQLHAPMLILQGLDDAVVPPQQADELAAALRQRSLPVSVVMFAGEGHGFRMPATRTRVLNDSLSFLSQLFGFRPAGTVEALTIENLPGAAH